MSLIEAADRERSNLTNGLGKKGSQSLPSGYSFHSPSPRKYDVNVVQRFVNLPAAVLLRLLIPCTGDMDALSENSCNLSCM